jgi:hypothetical protein
LPVGAGAEVGTAVGYRIGLDQNLDMVGARFARLGRLGQLRLR